MKLTARIALVRFAKIDLELREGSWPNATSLAAELEVTPRTIQRDIQFLRESFQAPIAYDAVRHGYRYTEAGFRLPFFRITEGEYLSLFLAERLLQAYGDTPIAADLTRFFAKIKAMLPDTVSLDPQHLIDGFSVRPTTQSLGDAKQFQDLVKSIEACEQLELVYWTASRDETCRRVVDPFHLASIDGDWYLVAYCHLREDLRTFSPGRIHSLKRTGTTFERPADFRIAEYLDGGFRKMRGAGPIRTVRLRFSPAIARLIQERIWHKSQVLTPAPEGAIIAAYEINHTLELKRWAMSWGADCEVLEPEELRQEIIDELRTSLHRLAAFPMETSIGGA